MAHKALTPHHGELSQQFFRRKKVPSFPVWYIVEHCTNQSCDPFSKSGIAIEMVFARKVCLLCSESACALTVVSFFIRSPIFDLTWSYAPRFWTSLGAISESSDNEKESL